MKTAHDALDDWLTVKRQLRVLKEREQECREAAELAVRSRQAGENRVNIAWRALLDCVEKESGE